MLRTSVLQLLVCEVGGDDWALYTYVIEEFPCVIPLIQRNCAFTMILRICLTLVTDILLFLYRRL